MIALPRKPLADALALLASALEVKTTMPILAFVKVEATQGEARLTTTRVDATLSVTVPGGGEEAYCLPLTPLREAMRLTSDESVRFELKDNRVEVIAGRSRHRLPFHPVDAFPVTHDQSGQTLSVDAQRLSDAISRVSPCADKREGRYATQGVCLQAEQGELNVVAFDGTQAGIVRLMDCDLTFQATVPNVAVPVLRAVLNDREIATLTVSENSLTVGCEGRKMHARLLLGQFPPWKKIVPTETPHVVRLNSEVRDAIRRCCVTASEGNLVRRRLNLEFSRESLTVRSYGGDGESIEEVPLSCPTLNGEGLVVKVNADQLLTFLEQVEAPELHLKDATSILLLSEGEHRYLHATLRPDA